MATLELLEALYQRKMPRAADVAAALDVSEEEALQQLRAASQEGLVAEEEDESRGVSGADFERRFWHLTHPAGFEELHRLQEERAGR